MSRTYRRRNDELPEWVKYDYKYGPDYRIVKIPYTGKELKKEVNKYYADTGGISARGPKWFGRLYHTVPRRQKERKALNQVMQLHDYEDSPEFPLSNKPVEYWD